MKGYLRVGRKLGRTVYLQRGDEAGDDDLLLGMMDTAEWATIFVNLYNAMVDAETEAEP